MMRHQTTDLQKILHRTDKNKTQWLPPIPPGAGV
jgi:hypothetical protein